MSEALHERLKDRLEKAGPTGMPIGMIYEAFADVPRKAVSDALQYLKRKTIAHTLANRNWALVQAAAVALPPGDVFAAAGALQAGELAAKAGAAIAKHEAGLDSAALATQLQSTPEAIDAALAQAVADHVLITCNLLRDGQRLVHYRLSALGPSKYSWADQRVATWLNKPNVAPPPRPITAAPAEPVAPAVTVKVPAPPAPVPAPAPETASEVVPPAQDKAPAQPLRYVGELDIDAVHRKHDVPPAPGESRFVCALFSDGELLIQSDEGRLQLPLAHTRKLLHYLDSLRGDDIVETALGELN